MRDILYPPHQPAVADPVRRAQVAMQTPPIRRFYREATVGEHEGRFRLLLDGRPAKTPARQPLALASRSAADLLAAEWAGQGETIRPTDMPLTKIVNSGLDSVAGNADAVADDIARYAGSDLVCYRAGDPARLVAWQSAAWDPVLAHARERHGLRFVLAEGVIHVSQPPETLSAVRALVGRTADPVALAAMHVLTTIGGSALIALAVADGGLAAEAAFDAAEVDERWSAETWGADAEAAARTALRRRDFLAAAGLLSALAKPAEFG
jgi:chaperone required for assembly of F1-ATPase